MTPHVAARCGPVLPGPDGERVRGEQELRSGDAILPGARRLWLEPAPEADPAWPELDAGVLTRLARAIRDGRLFERLPELAAALEQAGGADARLLDHLRRPGEHLPQCRALDLILGKG